jgi:hypothetical protein
MPALSARRWATLSALCLFAALPAAASRAQSTDPLQATIKSVGERTFEPTLGVDGAGRIFYSVTRVPGVAAGWRPGMFMSGDHGDTWKDISPAIAGTTVPFETNDPFVYVDQGTGRAFNFHMAPILTCTWISFTDDQGATWGNNPLGCGGQVPYDHQTIVASRPRTFPLAGSYPHLLLQCVNSVHSEECSRSLDGGQSWMPTNPAYPNSQAATGRGTQTGHMAAAPDGTIYLPTSEGGTKPVVYATDNDGLTWRRQQIADMSIPFTDPAIAVDRDGNLYAAWVDTPGNLYYAVSRNTGVTWTAPVRLATGITATLPALDVGDPGNVVVAFPGTTSLPAGFNTATGKQSCGKNVNCVGWNGYLAVSYDALGPAPTFQTVQANHDGPLFRGATACVAGGRCSYLTDFIDVTVGPDGRPYAAFSRGCTGACLTDATKPNNETDGWGILATLTSGPTLCASGCAEKFRP